MKNGLIRLKQHGEFDTCWMKVDSFKQDATGIALVFSADELEVRQQLLVKVGACSEQGWRKGECIRII